MAATPPSRESACENGTRSQNGRTGPAILAVSKGPQSHLRYGWWYGGSHGTDINISEIASPEATAAGTRRHARH